MNPPTQHDLLRRSKGASLLGHHSIIEASSHETYPFVHLHVQQLLALALGADPEKDCGLGSHSQDVEPLLERIGAPMKAGV